MTIREVIEQRIAYITRTMENHGINAKRSAHGGIAALRLLMEDFAAFDALERPIAVREVSRAGAAALDPGASVPTGAAIAWAAQQVAQAVTRLMIQGFYLMEVWWPVDENEYGEPQIRVKFEVRYNPTPEHDEGFAISLDAGMMLKFSGFIMMHCEVEETMENTVEGEAVKLRIYTYKGKAKSQ